ncbi:MAG: HAD family hydrolase [Roseburia sp.]
MKRGIIFDMDGTLWDSAQGVATAWNQVLKKWGIQRETLTEADIHSVMGKTMTVIADILFPMVGEQERGELLQECCHVENTYLSKNGGILYPELEETLQILGEKYPLYIVSNCQSGYIEAFLSYYRFTEYFADTECFGNNGKQKGENIALLAKRNELTEAVYVGDIQGDYDASVQAGVKFIHAAYGFGTVEQPVPKIDRFEELPAVVAELWGC